MDSRDAVHAQSEALASVKKDPRPQGSLAGARWRAMMRYLGAAYYTARRRESPSTHKTTDR